MRVLDDLVGSDRSASNNHDRVVRQGVRPDQWLDGPSIVAHRPGLSISPSPAAAAWSEPANA